jgi:hypothetical protein
MRNVVGNYKKTDTSYDKENTYWIDFDYNDCFLR